MGSRMVNANAAVLRRRPLTKRKEVEFTAEFEGWSFNFLKKNFWKVKHVMEWEDAMQELKVIFYHCREYYGNKITGPRHLMSLFQVSANNWLIDKAAYEKDSKYKLYIDKRVDVYDMFYNINVSESSNYRISETDNFGVALSSIMHAPLEVKESLLVILQAPIEVLGVVSTAIRTGKKYNAANKALCEFCGVDSKECDLVKCIREFFTIN